MSLNVTNIYVTEFDEEAKLAYERRGMRLPMTVRSRYNVLASEYRFPVRGLSSEATTKGNYDAYSLTGLSGTKAFATVSLTRNHWHDYVSRQDMLSMTSEDVSDTAWEAVQKVGQSIDNKITTAMDAGTTTVAAGSAGLTKAKILEAIETLNANNVPMDNRFALVDAAQWTDLLNIEEFASQDYVGYDSLPWISHQNARMWLGVMFILFPGLPLSTTIRSNFFYHMSSVGFASSQGLETEVAWLPEHDSWIVKATEQCGSIILDNRGLIKVEVDESA